MLKKMKVKQRNNSKFVLGSYGSCAMHSIISQQSCILDCFSTIMHIRFEDVQAVDDKVIIQTSRKCCKNFNQREIIALIIIIVFRLVKIQSHDENQCLSFFNERHGTTSVFPMCLFSDFMRAASVLF